MLTRRGGRVLWPVGCLLVIAALGTAMYFVEQLARGVAGTVREGIVAPGPPLTRATLPRVMGDVPLPPFFTLDEAASNDPALRLQMSLMLQHGQGEWIAVFRTTVPFDEAAAWYRRRLIGWTEHERGFEGQRRRRRRRSPEPSGPMSPNVPREIEWTRNGDRVSLDALPNRPGELILFISSPPPRQRGPR